MDQDQDLLTELRILGSICPQDRISTNHNVKPAVRIQKPHVFRSFCRFLASESRAGTVAYVQSLLQRVIDRHAHARESQDGAMAERIRVETAKAIDGIRKLQHTYQDDAQFQASIDVSVESVCIDIGLTHD